MRSRPLPDPSPPLLPIGAVVAEVGRVFPDVTRSSLRFLEREGLIAAARSRGGHRLYSRDDVERIMQIKRWQRQRLSLEEIRRRLAALDGLPTPAVLAERFVALSLAGNLARVRQMVLAADDVGLPLSRSFGDVLSPALAEVGRRWGEGSLLVSQEKEISELARELIVELSLRHAPPAPSGPAIVAACVAGERHELGLRMIAGLLRAGGYAVHFLGADVAPRFLLEAVRRHRPAVVLLSARLAPTLPAIRDALEALDAGLGPTHPPVLAGGQVVHDHAEIVRRWGAIPVASERFDEIIRAVETLVGPGRSRVGAG